MNAYLPSLAKESPEVLQILQEIKSKPVSPPAEDTISDHVDSPLIQRAPSEDVEILKARYDSELSRAMSRISSLGIALGYGAGIFLLLVAFVPVTMWHGSTFALRVAIGLSGIWWAVFSIPAALWLPGSESSAQDEEEAWSDHTTPTPEVAWSTSREVLAAWKRLGSMLRWREIKKLGNTFKYLAAWFLLSDGKSLLFRFVFEGKEIQLGSFLQVSRPSLRRPSCLGKRRSTCSLLPSSSSAL